MLKQYLTLALALSTGSIVASQAAPSLPAAVRTALNNIWRAQKDMPFTKDELAVAKDDLKWLMGKNLKLVNTVRAILKQQQTEIDGKLAQNVARNLSDASLEPLAEKVSIQIKALDELTQDLQRNAAAKPAAPAPQTWYQKLFGWGSEKNTGNASAASAAAADQKAAHADVKSSVARVSESDVKGAAAGAPDVWRQFVQQHRSYLGIMRQLHDFVATQAQYQVSGKVGKEISECVYQALDDPKKYRFLRPLCAIIGEYASPCSSVDIDLILTQIYGSALHHQMGCQGNTSIGVVNRMHSRHSLECGLYRENSKGRPQPWPLTAEDRRRGQIAGWTYAPSYIKPARMVCNDCLKGISPEKQSLWELCLLHVNGDCSQDSFMDAADHHDYSKSHPALIANLQAQAIQNPAICVNMPDSQKPEFLRYVLRHVNLRARQVYTDRLPAPDKVSKDVFFASEGWVKFHDAYYYLIGFTKVARFIDTHDMQAIPKTCGELQKEIMNTR